MQIETVRTPGLGDSTYILVHQGVGIVIDPQRDIDRFEGVLDETNAELRFVLETHLHNDYLSGGRDLARNRHAELVLPAGAAPSFRHRPAFHGEDMDGGPFSVRPIHTPGHTPEHMSYLVIVDNEAVALFSGGSLLVGSAGRSDLLGWERAETLSRLQHGSVNRLAKLDDHIGLYPTHGAGSFCTTSGASSFTSTIGQEKASNPVLAYRDEDEFVEGELSNLVPFPSYYAQMGPANLFGVDAVTSFTVPTISEADFAGLSDEVSVVDARPQDDFALGHLPGSLAVELRRDFGTWVGWVLPFNSPLVLVLNADQDSEEAIRQLSRIGFDDVLGLVVDLPDWSAELTKYQLVSKEQFASAVVDGAQVLDVRAPNEWDAGFIAKSVHRYVPDLADGAPEVDGTEPVWVACGTGYRANIAASLLGSTKYDLRVLGEGGVTDVLSELSNQGRKDWFSTPSPADEGRTAT